MKKRCDVLIICVTLSVIIIVLFLLSAQQTNLSIQERSEEITHLEKTLENAKLAATTIATPVGGCIQMGPYFRKEITTDVTHCQYEDSIDKTYISWRVNFTPRSPSGSWFMWYECQFWGNLCGSVDKSAPPGIEAGVHNLCSFNSK